MDGLPLFEMNGGLRLLASRVGCGAASQGQGQREHLPPKTMPLVIICGPPCSGKTRRSLNSPPY